MLIAHQYPESEASWLIDAVADRAALVPVGQDADRWHLPEGAESLLVHPTCSRSLSPASPAPAGWPGSLQWVHFRSTGIDRLPAWIFEVPHVTVSRGAQAEAIAEFVLATMLEFEKRLADIRVTDRLQWRPVELGGLTGKTLGLLGFGMIGREVARRAKAFDMHVIAHRRDGAATGVAGVEAVSFVRLMAESDHLVLCAALTPETRGMVGREALAQLRTGAHLINVARGALLDTEALREALGAGRVARASLDVTDPEPLPEGHWAYAHPHVYLTSHVSFSGPVTRTRGQEILAGNLELFLAGRSDEMRGLVDMPKGY